MGILFSFFKRRVDTKTLMVGLDAAGKTTILYKLNLGEYVLTIPTLGFNVENVEYANVKFQIWDVGGQDKLRRLWKHYYKDTSSIIFVVDSYDVKRLDKAKEELHRMIEHPLLANVKILIFANKQDISGALRCPEITEKLELNKINSHEWFCQECCATNGNGLAEGFEWLSSKLG